MSHGFERTTKTILKPKQGANINAIKGALICKTKRPRCMALVRPFRSLGYASSKLLDTYPPKLILAR